MHVMLVTCRRLAMVAGLVAATALPAPAQGQGVTTAPKDGEWQFTVAPYMWFTAVDGDISVKGLPQVQIPIEASFSQIFDKWNFGFAGHFEARKEKFGLGGDIMYNRISAPVAASAPVLAQLGLEAGVKQYFTEGFGLYRVASGGRPENPAHLDLLAGVRYAHTRNELSATNASGGEYDGVQADLDWVDALGGMRFTAPLGARCAVMGRVDIAGLGTKLTYNLEGDLGFRPSPHWVFAAGWRHMHIDYDKGSGKDRQVFEMAYDGPRAWFAYTW